MYYTLFLFSVATCSTLIDPTSKALVQEKSYNANATTGTTPPSVEGGTRPKQVRRALDIKMNTA